MNEISEWRGKTDTDINITYDVGLFQSDQRLLTMAVGENQQSFPAITYTRTDNTRDVVEFEWDNDIAQKADRWDYLMAVASGSIAGLIDVFYVGDFSLEEANLWGNDRISKFVRKVASLKGFKGDDLSDAIAFMERTFGFAADSKMNEYGGSLQHHLRDFSHHFSLGGLICSLFTQFTGKVVGTDATGALLIEPLSDTSFIGNNFEEKIFLGTINWFFHMVSDMAGSSARPGKGTGIPGPLLSLIKEVSALPCFKDKKINEMEIRVWISKLFNGTFFKKYDANGQAQTVRFDLRTEIGILHEFDKQLVPVIINECLVRSLYFLRRLYLALKNTEIHSKLDFRKINVSELVPFNNRIIRRMITVASGTFTAIDLAEAAIHASIKNRGLHPGTLVDFAVRINIAGIGRFIIACKEDGSFVAEDIRQGREDRIRAQKQYEKAVADMKCLTLDFEQTRVLCSLEKKIIDYDIEDTQDIDVKNVKQKWESLWQKQILEPMSLTLEAKNKFFLSEADIGSYYRDKDDGAYQYLIVMEASLFNPYGPLGDQKRDQDFSKLKYKGNYLKNRFVKIQNRIQKTDIDKMMSAYKKAASKITGSAKNIAIGAIGTGALAVATGGMALTFAPAIAAALVGGGGAAASLSGAALTSYSLAAIGGGSLAAGGFGMAGGTAVITGGGALLGMLGGTGASAATTLGLLSEDGYVLKECCRLLAFSKVVLHDKYKDYKTIENIHMVVDNRIQSIKAYLLKVESDSELKKNHGKEIKTVQKSIKFLKNCDDVLKKLLKDENVVKDANEIKIPIG